MFEAFLTLLAACEFICMSVSFFVLQYRIPAPIRTEAVCTSVELMVARPTVTVKLATPLLPMGKPVKVN